MSFHGSGGASVNMASSAIWTSLPQWDRGSPWTGDRITLTRQLFTDFTQHAGTQVDPYSTRDEIVDLSLSPVIYSFVADTFITIFVGFYLLVSTIDGVTWVVLRATKVCGFVPVFVGRGGRHHWCFVL